MKIDDLHAIEVDSGGDIAGEVGVFILSVPGQSPWTVHRGLEALRPHLATSSRYLEHELILTSVARA